MTTRLSPSFVASHAQAMAEGNLSPTLLNDAGAGRRSCELIYQRVHSAAGTPGHSHEYGKVSGLIYGPRATFILESGHSLFNAPPELATRDKRS